MKITNSCLMSVVKPNALTADILNSAKMFEISLEDRVIVCVGQHNFNPLKMIAEFTIQLILISLNYTLQLIGRQYNDCIFVNHNSYLFNYYHKVKLCNEINSTLGQIDYTLKFLPFFVHICKSLSQPFPKRAITPLRGHCRP